MKIKRRCPKKENRFFTGSGAQWRQQLLSLSALAQPELHSGGCIRKNPDRRWLSAEDGIALQAEDAAAVAPDADENQGAAADQNAVQGRMANNAETCFAEIYLEVATANSGKITWRIVNESDTEIVGWGTDYTLERFTENGWEIVENSDADLETQKESSQAVAGETKEGTLDLAADGIRLEAGQYRLKKECRIFDDENSRQTELTAEFQVEP